jgi:LAS superfamily LD-carboxypeptidase LdcB
MSNKKTYLLSIAGVVLFLAFLSSFGLSELSVYGQSILGGSNISTATTSQSSAPKQTQPLVTKTSSASPITWANAMVDNIRFKDSLSWTFGGKSQRGWYLYVPLIKQTIGTEAEPNTPDFASAVAVWQQKNWLPATGTIERETLYQMIKNWQAQRLNRSQYPTEDKLLTAPIADFYDPNRSYELLKVERETYAAYKRMIAAAAKDLNLKISKNGEFAPDEKYLRIISAFRSREYQAKLRAADPAAGRAGLARHSPHFTGNALDIYVGGEPVETENYNRAVQVQTPVYKWLVKNAARFGFYPYYYEPWHWEYVPQNIYRQASPIQNNTVTPKD